ncbi:DUF2569 domain-containing protein [Yersinia kristensenii]|uniref:DUF2569 domain-containing protein n=1 Tax=Yersinia kristensenii TaxID=28152 RepID=UPI000C1F0845|nr:DUF2569 domain-containing protein [Yersinia kristensenii]MDA5472118.1 DUF2569 domain-containing protein [Yersinia kristensenii]MDA5477007.1 DUF2569 domain-containing protein [Yersinia kristensenii]MDA5505585.1 DUF2569 domain-containing protein [Yersinia kristensenii]NIK94470.1 DUF2569 domain-containing protein [Yersinia kristensenii]NIL05617.1 DUF2569 domain-containing protein [Yersinia kristensenii]
MSQQQEYQRIGGWLLAPLAYLIVTLLSASLMLALYAMAIFTPESREYLVTNSQAFTLQWYFSVVTTLVMWFYTLWVIWLFCSRSKRLPQWFILWLLITVLLALKAFAFAPISDGIALRALGWPLLAAAVFVPYIKRSQRVKSTFIEH